MPSEESAEQNKKQRGVRLKILTLDQILSRLPNTLAGNNSQKLKNEIRQLLYSLYLPKKLTKTIYNNFININTENNKTNESHRFRQSLVDKLNLKNPNKDTALGNLSIYYTWKNIKSA